MRLLPYRLAASKLLFTKSLNGLMCSSLVNNTWLAMLCRIWKDKQEKQLCLIKKGRPETNAIPVKTQASETLLTDA